MLKNVRESFICKPNVMAKAVLQSLHCAARSSGAASPRRSPTNAGDSTNAGVRGLLDAMRAKVLFCDHWASQNRRGMRSAGFIRNHSVQARMDANKNECSQLHSGFFTAAKFAHQTVNASDSCPLVLIRGFSYWTFFCLRLVTVGIAWVSVNKEFYSEILRNTQNLSGEIEGLKWAGRKKIDKGSRRQSKSGACDVGTSQATESSGEHQFAATRFALKLVPRSVLPALKKIATS